MKLAALFFVFLSSMIFADAPLKRDEIIDYAFYHLAETGVLKQDGYGFVYVDVDDNYIYKMIDLIYRNNFKP